MFANPCFFDWIEDCAIIMSYLRALHTLLKSLEVALFKYLRLENENYNS